MEQVEKRGNGIFFAYCSTISVQSGRAAPRNQQVLLFLLTRLPQRIEEEEEKEDEEEIASAYAFAGWIFSRLIFETSVVGLMRSSAAAPSAP